MGMTFSVYVGPYVKACGARNGNERELLDSFEDILQEGRGEAGVYRSDDNSLYAIPSAEIMEQGFGRQFTASESGESPVAVLEKEVRRDIEMMGNLANTFIAAVESCGGKCEVLWGVVCKMA